MKHPHWPALITACMFGLAPVLPARAAALIYSNDIMGELEPCGCRTDPMGGVVRKSVLLSRLEKVHGAKNFLSVDAGNFLFASDVIPELLKPQAVLQAEKLVEAHNLMGHDIVVPGPKDFALGMETFRNLARRAKFDFIAANLEDSKGKPLLKPRKVFTLRKKDGKPIRIGVFGLAGDELRYGEGLKVTPSRKAARNQVRALKKAKVDLIVAVTHQGYEADQALASSLPGIDLIVGGHSQSFLQQPGKVNETDIYQSSFRNQFVGTLDLDRRGAKGAHELVELNDSFDPKDGTNEKSASSLAGRMVKLVAEFKASVAKLNTDASTAQPASAHPASAEVKYQTFPRCAGCHVRQFDFWRKTAHANALAPLVKSKQIRNKECLACHTVGLGDSEGFSDVMKMGALRDAETPDRLEYLEPELLSELLTRVHEAKSMDEKIRLRPASKARHPMQDAVSVMGPTWAPVQCENCHQPGGEHPFTDGYRKTVETSSCLQCHTRERAPQWWTTAGKPDMKRISAKLKSITCPADE